MATIKVRRGLNSALPAGGTQAGEPRFSTDTGQLYVDNGISNVEITPNSTNVAAAGAIMDSDFGSNGVMARTASGTYASRTVTGTANEISVSNGDGVSGNPTLSLPATIDLGGKTSLEIPNSAAPTVDADGEIAVDTTVTDFSHGILKYYSTEELGVVAMPIAQFTSPTNNYVVTYDSTADEFQLKAGGSSPLTTNNDLYYYSSGNARLAGPSFPTQRLTVGVNNTLNWFRMNEIPIVIPCTFHTLLQTTSGTGSSNILTTRWGRIGREMRLGTTTTGTCSLRHMDSFSPFSEGDGSVTFKTYASFIFDVRDLSDATQEYLVQIGQHGRLSSSTAQTDGAFFLYDRATYGNANLQCITRNSSISTTTDSGVAVTADTQILLDICWSNVSGTPTNVFFYINGTLVATHTSSDNLFTGSSNVTYFALKSAGTTDRYIFGGDVFITGGQG